MKIKTSLALLFFFLAACAPVVTPAPTGTPVPSMGPPTFTPTAKIIYPTPSLYPTQHPPPILTPDAIQVERWKEYQTELAKALFVYNPAFPQWDYGPAVSKDAICEWDILERSGQEVYLWAACITADGLYLRTNPTVIYLEPDGSIREVKVASVKIDRPEPYLIYDLHLFPMNIQEKLCLYYFDGYMPQCHEVNPAYIIPLDYWQSRDSVLVPHLKYRIGYPEEPPLIVLSAMPTAMGHTPVGITPSPMPSQPIIPVITPDAIQVERWKEYQTELAKLVLSEAGYIFPDYASALCEWDILGRSGQEVYVWAMCLAPNAGDRKPAVIHLNLDGTIQKVEVPFHDSTWESTIQKLFPTDVQRKIDEYFYPMYSGRAEELRIHLVYRLTHPDVPPLIILSGMPTATPAP